MTGSAVRDALYEATVFLSLFEDFPDYRQKGTVAYPLDEALLLMLTASLAGAETVADLARFGQTKLHLLKRFRAFANGRLRTINWASSSPSSTRPRFSVALRPGRRH